MSNPNANGPGYWAEEVVSLLKSGAGKPGFTRPKLCIVSGYPDGLAPYERSEVSKECLLPTNTNSRDWQVGVIAVGFLEEARMPRYEKMGTSQRQTWFARYVGRGARHW